jgi:hypothetical protein
MPYTFNVPRGTSLNARCRGSRTRGSGGPHLKCARMPRSSGRSIPPSRPSHRPSACGSASPAASRHSRGAHDLPPRRNHERRHPPRHPERGTRHPERGTVLAIESFLAPYTPLLPIRAGDELAATCPAFRADPHPDRMPGWRIVPLRPLALRLRSFAHPDPSLDGAHPGTRHPERGTPKEKAPTSCRQVRAFTPPAPRGSAGRDFACREGR